MYQYGKAASIIVGWACTQRLSLHVLQRIVSLFFLPGELFFSTRPSCVSPAHCNCLFLSSNPQGEGGELQFICGALEALARDLGDDPNQQRTLNKIPTELRCRNFVNKSRLNVQIGAKRVKMYMQCGYIPTELPFCLPPLVVGIKHLEYPEILPTGQQEALGIDL